MNDLFGFDFADSTRTVEVDSAPGTWSFDAFHKQDVRAALYLAAKALDTLPDEVIPLYAAALEEARSVIDEFDRDPGNLGYLWSRLRSIDVDASDDAEAMFIDLCKRAAANGADTDGLEFKVQEGFDQSLYVLHAEGVGSLVARHFMTTDVTSLCYQTWRTPELLPSYRDDMQCVELPHAVWGRAMANGDMTTPGDSAPRVPTFRYLGRDYVVYGTVSPGGGSQMMFGQAWRLCLPEEWPDGRHSYKTLLESWNAGTRKRGDKRGLLVSANGASRVVDRAMLVYDPKGRAAFACCGAGSRNRSGG